MFISKKQLLFLLYTTAIFFASTVILSLIANRSQLIRNVLDKWGFLAIFCVFLVIITIFFLAIPFWNYIQAYRMAKKIYQLDKELLMTAEEILFLERIFTLKQIFELSINDPDKKRGLLKILSRSICVSQAMEK